LKAGLTRWKGQAKSIQRRLVDNDCQKRNEDLPGRSIISQIVSAIDIIARLAPLF